nr:putative zinc finger, CCHC-type, retrotransposon Gag domain protein [Tanacetum cinerariifolium]
MNGWLIEDDNKDVEEYVEGNKDDEEMEVDEEDEDDGVDDNEDEAEVINAYKEFGHNFHVGEGSSTGALLAGNNEVNAPGPIACNLESVRWVATRLDKQMFDRGRMPAESRFEEDPPIYTASTLRADDPYVMIRDAVMAAREDDDDDITAPRYPQPSEPHGSPHDSQTMPPRRRSQTNPQTPLTQEAVNQLVRDEIEAAIRAERERVREEATRVGGPAGGLVAAPVARECTFTGFTKCGPTQFYRTEGAVGLCRCFERMKSTFGISECAKRRKVKFATATLHGRAIT